MMAPFAVAVYRIEAYRVTLQPGQETGWRHHAGGTVGYIEAGAGRFQVDGQPAATLRTGDAFCEPPGTTIAHCDNAPDTEPATFVACYPLAGDQALIEMHTG